MRAFFLVQDSEKFPMRSCSSFAFRSLLLTAVAVLFAGHALPEGPSVDKLNKKIDNITLKNADGKALALYDHKDKKAVVIVFVSFECPVSNSYAPVLAELYKTYGDKGVAFLAVNSTDDGDAAQIAKQAAEFKYPFPVLKDDKHQAADALKAEVVSEAFVLDRNFVLRYRGRIDNAYAARLKKNTQVTKHDLQQALDEILAGKDVSEPATKAFGCFVSREKNAKTTAKVTYYKDVLPILQENCQQCHRPGEVGPFSLMSYDQAVNWASDVKEYARDRKMPPWKPVDGQAFRHERKLTDKDIEVLTAWADGGTPEGDKKDAPKPREFVDGWQLGKPDLILTVPEEMTVDAAGKDLFRCFVLPTKLDEDKHVVAVEVRPGNKRVLHHTLNFWDTTGNARKKEEQAQKDAKPDDKDHGPGYSSSMGIGVLPQPGKFGALSGWAPGQIGYELPEGTGFLLPKGADVIVQCHYHRTGRVEKDQTSIGLYFAKKPVKRPFEALVIPATSLEFFLDGIPAGDARFHVKGGIVVQEDCKVYSIMPHMHMLGREVKVTLTPPDGKPMTLVAIKDWDYNWQETYWFKDSIDVKKGTKMNVEAVYDNSDKNPSNPSNPPKQVRFGEQTTNEMLFIFLGATKDGPGRIKFTLDGQRRLGGQ
jgi:peroxiredoxin/mono/diheme cytochrome c family protein